MENFQIRNTGLQYLQVEPERPFGAALAPAQPKLPAPVTLVMRCRVNTWEGRISAEQDVQHDTQGPEVTSNKDN